MIYLITGGVRSGKSSYGQQLAQELSEAPIYLATSRVWDGDHAERIKRHQADRDDTWTTIEEEKALKTHDFYGKTVVIDCITLWLNNFFYDNKNDVEKTLSETREELNELFLQNANFIIISNELGMGLHAETEIGRKFADLQGWINQHIARQADIVYLMVSGIPLKVK